MKTGGDQANRILDQLQAKFAATEARINSLKNQLQGSGTTIKATGQHWQEFGNSARNALGSLSGLGGPLGSVAGKVEQLGSQLNSLVSTFGVVGGGTVALAAGLVAAGAAFVGFSIKGAKVADELLDISEATGLSIDHVQRLGAAMQRSGEDVSGVERAFTKFQQTVQTAIDDPTSKAATNLRRLGVVATDAGRDTEKAFINTLSQLKELRTSTEGAAASNEVFGRGIGALVRTNNELSGILGKTRKELQETGVIASDLALGAASDLDKSISRLSQSFSTFTTQLNGLSGGVISGIFSDISDKLEEMNGWMTRASNNPFWQKFSLITEKALEQVQGVTGAAPVSGRTGINAGPFGNIVGLRDPVIAEPARRPTGGGGGKAEPRIDLAATFAELEKFNRIVKENFEASKRIAEAFYAVGITNFTQYTNEIKRLDKQFRSDQLVNANQITDELTQQLEGLKASGASAENIERVQKELSAVTEESIRLSEALGVKVLPQIEKFIEQLTNFGRINLALGSAPKLTGIPGVTDLGRAPHPDDIGRPPTDATRPRIVNEQRPQDRERINQEFSAIFEDFIVQTITARKGLKEAFGDLALGVVDVFASEFAKAFQASLQRHVIAPLANLLEGALDSLFGGVSGKGIGKFFGSILKSFGGFFDTGGVLGANRWGVVGETGPEIISTGSRPVTISPMGAMAGGGTNNFTFHVNTQGGQVDRRSMDQLADTVYSAVSRAQRNKGA